MALHQHSRISTTQQEIHFHSSPTMPLLLAMKSQKFVFLCKFCFFCITFAESEPYCHSILFVCLDVCWSFGDLQPTMIDHNQIWSAGIYLSLEPCKPFWIPYLPYSRCQREKLPMCILATANVTHGAI